jgi:methyl-accepting chemotaxis protein
MEFSMKINMPVTDHEVMFDDSQFMLTKTDMKGVITYANADFIKVSGFSEAELVGHSHNVVRHPDMPAEAFADMWKQLKAGRPWRGLVKNRCKNGDFYWVDANATPLTENGKITGFLSARRKPTREQIEATSQIYQAIKKGQAKGLAIVDGQAVRQNWMYKIKAILNNVSVVNRLNALVLISLAVITGQSAVSLYLLSGSNENFKTIYQDRMVPIEDLGKIKALMIENRTLLRAALSEAKVVVINKTPTLVLDASVAEQSATDIEANIAAISQIWKQYMATKLTPEEAALAASFAKSRGEFVKNGLQPAVNALRNHDYVSAKQSADQAKALYAAAGPNLAQLLKLQSDVAQETYASSNQQYQLTQRLTIMGLIMTVLALFGLGWLISRSITRPLGKTLAIFDHLTHGDYTSSIDAPGNNELSQALNSLKSMQTLLSVNENSLKESKVQTEEQAAVYEGQLAAISRSTGVIAFDMQGYVIDVNDIFLNVLGYEKSEVIGKHHSIFVDADYKLSAEYKELWAKLNRAESLAGQFMRLGKNTKEIWLEASYNPILCAEGKPYKVVKYATDITEQKLKNADFEGQMSAIGKSQGVIELALDGTVLKANQVYLDMLGYAEQELIGQHVSKVLDPTFARSSGYTDLWNKLVNGGTDSGQYKRIAKNGSEVWIQASYNPIYDLKGKPCKVVNYTIDITQQKLQAADNAGQLAAINEIQGVIEFDLKGNVTKVNDNFANVTGYAVTELIGKHHSMFVEPSHKNSTEYRAFWDKLNRGEADTGQYKRITKSGGVVWLQASYNPILDMNGKPFKVVEYTTDITEQHNNASSLQVAVEETQSIIQSAQLGDLTNRVSLDGKSGAIASLCDGVNALLDNMTEVLISVKEAGETINTAASEISTGNNDLSERTEQQASSLEETASSMEELASTVKQNADNAKQANQLAATASTVALKGGEVVGNVVTTMSAINASARKIEDIISVIDGIAFQTNILALNAAVEAARAGEQGRGFAVVAGEVRNLAQRSASAAKEIKELIADSVSKTTEGTRQVETAGQTMDEIVSSVQRVTDIMGEIAAASSEQSSGIDQINNAITSMDEVTQQNAALVEEAAAAAESLVEQAITLMETVGNYKLKGAIQERRSSGSAMRQAKPVAASRPTTRLVPEKVAKKTGTDDTESWEEF